MSLNIRLQLLGDGWFDWEVVRLDAALAMLARESNEYRSALRRALASSCQGTLSAILYADEVTPGNPLRPDNRRRFWSFYIGFQELGPVALSREQYWIPLAVLRTCKANSVRGGLSAAFRALVRACLLAPANLAVVGMPIEFDEGGPQLLRIKITNILADESALKSLWSVKGAAGVRPCFLCKNVVSIHSRLAQDSGYLVDIGCADASCFDLATDEDIWSSWDDLALQRGHLGKGAFELRERACGLSFNEDGVLSDLELRRFLRPVSMTTLDFMHCFLQSGVVAQELAGFLSSCKAKLRAGYSHIQTLAGADWRFPKSLEKGKLDAIFCSARERSADEGWKASASETLVALPLVRYFAETVARPSGLLEDECASFCMVCEIVDRLMCIKRGGPKDRELLKLVRRHLEAHRALYGDLYLKPKHHLAWHNVSKALSSDLFLDTFVLERKHRLLKRAGTDIRNSVRYESSVLGRVLVEQLRQLQSNTNDGLLGTQRPFPALRMGASVAKVFFFRVFVFPTVCSDMLQISKQDPPFFEGFVVERRDHPHRRLGHVERPGGRRRRARMCFLATAGRLRACHRLIRAPLVARRLRVVPIRRWLLPSLGVRGHPHRVPARMVI